MTEGIINIVKSIVRLNKAEEDAFLSILEVKKMKKNELLLREGQVCNFVIFIHTGCLRYFYMKDGEEITGQFFIENDWYTDLDSFIRLKPSEQSIQVLENTTCFVINKRKLEQLYVDFPVFERFGRIMTEQGFLGLYNANRVATLLTSEERYLAFIKNQPSIVQRVPQHYIASYLGLKPQSLSRIRKRLFLKK
jgi:CRP/FNR family transcriptional regulator, anaerobic regulatory protein